MSLTCACNQCCKPLFFYFFYFCFFDCSLHYMVVRSIVLGTKARKPLRPKILSFICNVLVTQSWLDCFASYFAFLVNETSYHSQSRSEKILQMAAADAKANHLCQLHIRSNDQLLNAECDICITILKS